MTSYNQCLCKGLSQLTWNHCSSVEIPCKGINSAMNASSPDAVWDLHKWDDPVAGAGLCSEVAGPHSRLEEKAQASLNLLLPALEPDTALISCPTFQGSRGTPVPWQVMLEGSYYWASRAGGKSLAEALCLREGQRTIRTLGKSHTSKLRNVFSHSSFRNLTLF